MDKKTKVALVINAVLIVLAIICIINVKALRRECEMVTEQVESCKVKYSAISSEIETKVKIEVINKAVETEPQKRYIGTFKLTAYCSCEKCCGIWALNRPLDDNGNEIVYGASGDRLYEGYSIAVDPTVIPYGTEVEIDGNIYKAQDCGGAIKGNRIDVYHSSHEEALKFGVGEYDVYVLEEQK